MYKVVSMIALLVVISTSALAGKRTLTATEIKLLLTGNTAIGRWIDHDYRQYFGADGSTIYAQRSEKSSLGRWRTNSTRHHYESWWERSDWGAGFSIILDDETYYWVSSTGTTAPQSFVIIEGQHLLFED
jgi:hypothetical protein